MAKYKYLFFDLDGTIINTFEGVTRSFAYALESYGIRVSSLEELRPVLGPPLRDAFMNMYGFEEADAVDAVEKYRERYNNRFIAESELYPGIADTLKKLFSDGFVMAVATAKPEHFALPLLEHYGLKDYFHCIAGATLDKSRDSKKAVLAYLIDKLKITDNSEVLMIGDRKYDMEGAAHFGIDGMGVLYGFGSREEMEASPHVLLADDAADLYRKVTR